MICPRCGKELFDNETFCSNCGTPVNNIGEQVMNEPTYSNGNYTYKLTLTRPKNFVGSLATFKVFIDDQLVGKIKNGGTLQIEIPSGTHLISINKNNAVNIEINEDTTADVVVFGANNFGIANVSGQANNETNAQLSVYAEKSKKKHDYLLYSSIILPIISVVMFYTIQYVIAVWTYGIVIGIGIINIAGLKNQNITSEERTKAVIKNFAAMIISIIAIIVTMNVTI